MEGRRSSLVKMKSWRAFLCFKRSLLSPAKNLLLKVTSHLKNQAKGKSKGLVGLYKEMESCGEYADIRVMWEMIHSSCPANATNTRSSKRSHWGFCFRST